MLLTINKTYGWGVVKFAEHALSLGHDLVVNLRRDFGALSQSLMELSFLSYLFVPCCKSKHKHTCSASGAVAEHHYLFIGEVY
jgi:hypothetical protein